jgi:hypothetical protein
MTRAAGWAARGAAPAVALLLGSLLLGGCGASPAPLGPAGVDELTIPTPSPDPADFAGGAQNAWFPLERGTRWTYLQYTPTGNRRVVASVLPARPLVDGIATTAVRWQVQIRGRLHTAMVRWYAVDSGGNVWWFGQRVYRHTPRLDRLAPLSWRAGIKGAEAGLLLTATPRDGDGYLNASQPRVVARRSTVMTLDGRVATTTHTYRHTVVTRDLSSLAPLHSVQTFYGRGLGMVAQQDTTSTSTSLALVRVHRG